MLLKLVFYSYTYFILIDFAWRIDESCRVIVQNEVLRSVRLYSHKVAFALRLRLIVVVPVVVFRHLSDDFLRQSLVIVVSKDLFQRDLPTVLGSILKQREYFVVVLPVFIAISEI